MSFISNLVRIIRVEGDSMSPCFKHGDYVFLSSLFYPKISSVVVVDHPDFGVVIKRVKALSEGRLLLEGDNVNSLSSEQMGWIESRQVKGVVIYRST